MNSEEHFFPDVIRMNGVLCTDPSFLVPATDSVGSPGFKDKEEISQETKASIY